MDLPAFLDLKGYGHLLLDGAFLTLTVGISAMVVALALGILGALARLSQRRWLRRIGAVYATVVRGIPELVLMLLVYYGGTMLLQRLLSLNGGDVRVDINAFFAGTLVLGIRLWRLCHRDIPRRVPCHRSRPDRRSASLRHERTPGILADRTAPGLALCHSGARQSLADPSQSRPRSPRSSA